MCVFILGCSMKHWTLLCIEVYIFSPACFLHNLYVLNSTLSDKILYLVSFTFKWAKQKMAAKTTSFLYFCYKLLPYFWILHDFELINLCFMFFDQNDFYFTFKFKMVSVNTTNKNVFYARELWYHKQHYFNENIKIDYVIRQIRLQLGIRNCDLVQYILTCFDVLSSQYCGEPPWPRGSVLGLRPPGFEFRILCLEDSVISIISPSSGGSPGPV